MHPYPRKLVHSPKKEVSPAEHSTSSLSPNLSLSEQENQSPKSVLFAMGSDIGSSGSDTPDGSLSPVSSSPGIRDGSFMISEPNLSSDDTGSPSAAAVSVPDDRFAMVLASLSCCHIFIQLNVFRSYTCFISWFDVMSVIKLTNTSGLQKFLH